MKLVPSSTPAKSSPVKIALSCFSLGILPQSSKAVNQLSLEACQKTLPDYVEAFNGNPRVGRSDREESQLRSGRAQAQTSSGSREPRVLEHSDLN